MNKKNKRKQKLLNYDISDGTLDKNQVTVTGHIAVVLVTFVHRDALAKFLIGNRRLCSLHVLNNAI